MYMKVYVIFFYQKLSFSVFFILFISNIKKNFHNQVLFCHCFILYSALFYDVQ